MDVKNGFGYNFDAKNNGRRSQNVQNAPCNDVLPRRRRRKVYSRRKTTATPRKNRPYPNLHSVTLECCSKHTCLLTHGHHVIGTIRREFDSKLYEEQNNYLSSLIDITKHQKRRIKYHIKDSTGETKVQICKQAFLKIFGIGKTRLRVLLKKLQPYSGSIQSDQRQFLRNQRRIPLGIKAEVIELIRNQHREMSHYGRAKTKEAQYYTSSLSVSHLWRQFLANKGLTEHDIHPISQRSFRNIVRTYQISFRRPRIDTCSKCDSLMVIVRHSPNDQDVSEAKTEKEAHIRQASFHYDRIHYDLNIFPKQKNRADNARPWLEPPVWVT